ncbi:uncharacterized protein MONOS_14832 [Monocercomonoides exilis]|uniref:uncharacterized protein n=1 Tax=Monocercomonoides exilis TaxID=2049356 RepID=UPI003559889B|nr:hypothetical protein MONOS_14832 [Monocercomonoides exilis]|eukprot:MONOS_14832.1-p1 / transcript=MONOS_14832.1 / gene=MONOS_14832 / organism=Monocercomonoides_exilis_PA203 / gene_product=unspecified product / transcript_product=unspecified product / location=Mono_scaffold01082:14716-16387(-) / protein_length=429 / sequence_SO=supercontig / SO=protein_coding / is_pseudo=false
MQKFSIIEKFTELFSELGNCKEEVQKQKIEELYGLMDKMDKKEFKSIFSRELFDKIGKMLEANKLSLENTIVLSKFIGFCNSLQGLCIESFDSSLLGTKFEKMIIEENKKKEGKNEKLLIGLCECFLALSYDTSSELIPVCVPCLLKGALNKEENEEIQKEGEMALLALSCVDQFYDLRQDLYLNEIKEIITYHKEHRNLTCLAYQSIWNLNELHFLKEAAKELEELSKCVDWKKKEVEEISKEESKKELILMRWIEILEIYFLYCNLWNEEYVSLFSSIVQVSRAARENKREICYWCICSLRSAAKNRNVRVEDLLKGGAIDVVLEEMNQSTLDDAIIWNCLNFFLNISRRLKEKEDDEKEEEERKELKRKIFEKMEEKGFEDCEIGFRELVFEVKNLFIAQPCVCLIILFLNLTLKYYRLELTLVK